MSDPVRHTATFWECAEEEWAYIRAVREIQPEFHRNRDDTKEWIDLSQLLEEISSLARSFYGR